MAEDDGIKNCGRDAETFGDHFIELGLPRRSSGAFAVVHNYQRAVESLLGSGCLFYGELHASCSNMLAVIDRTELQLDLGHDLLLAAQLCLVRLGGDDGAGTI